MRCFVRKSKKPYVEVGMVFKVSNETIKFYEKLFSCPYPFSKYDIIYCPEFRITAMENVGATTFTDRVLLPKDQMTDVMLAQHMFFH
jgi:aminopeptidase N